MYFLIVALLSWPVKSAGDTDSTPASPSIVTADVDDRPITPVTARYLQRVIRQAEKQQASAVVIKLDTPGGLMKSTQTIVKNILNSNVPIIVYVSPAGGRAASAGVFITMSAHVAVMTPGTHIGAAHPVKMGGGGPGGLPQSGQQQNKKSSGKQDSPSSAQEDDNEQKRQKTESPEKESDKTSSTPLEEKQVNDAIAWIRSLANLRKRNADWGEKAVSESVSITAEEALEKNVVDMLATDLDELTRKADGTTVEINEKSKTLQLSGAKIKSMPLWWGEKLLYAVSNPNLAFIFLMLGFYGLLFELYTGGWGVSGTVGVICLLVAFFSLSILPLNYVALGLIAVALAMFVAEAFVMSFGALTVGGVVCLCLGGIMLIDTPVEFMKVSAGIVIPIAVATALITVILVSNVIRGYRKKVQTGDQELSGKRVNSAGDFELTDSQYKGLVWMKGEYWDAVSSTPVKENQTVEIQRREGLTLKVKPVDNSEENDNE